MRTPITLYYDTTELSLIYNSAGTYLTDSIPAQMIRNDHYEITLNVYNDAPTQANLSSINTSSYQYEIGPLGEEYVVISTDFDSSNAASGILITNVNTHSANLTADILTSPEKWYYSVITGTDDAIGSSQIIARFQTKILNTVGTSS